MVALLIFVLPPLVYYLLYAAENGGAFFIPTSGAEFTVLLSRVAAPTAKSVMAYGAWFTLQALLQAYAPGKVEEGTPLADGTRLKYKMNGWFSFWTTWTVIGVLLASGLLSPTFFCDELFPLFATVNLFTVVLCVFLYWYGRRTEDAGSGHVLRDYWMGTALNPRIGNFDLKLFCEARPGLILWAAADLSFAAKQIQLYGYVTAPMVLVCAFQFLYVADYFFHEPAILTTWDIKHERFGFMLCWGDLVWVPFTYSLQAHYLVNHSHDLPLWALIGIVVLNMAGYAIFRGANLQKHRFRANPNSTVWGQRPEYIATAKGTRLLTSGFWGVARHMNYTGDLMMGLAWCLLTGFRHPLPYFYIVYFTILLVHREWRDHATCRDKYGADWDVYCKKVRWRMLPGLY